VPVPEGAAVLAPDDGAVPAEVEPAEPDDTLPPAAAEKLDQIKDLLITAEAIGEANLDRHFDRVSQRQRELIREFFDRAMPGSEPEA
jgi:Tat protein secretion system quality control protein TatD with DNase activity